MTTQLHTAAKLALDALRQCEFTSPPAQRPIVKEAITALRSALAAPMPEPWICAADRMPEPNVNVLCFSDLNSQPVIASWAGRDYNWIPTHWMPLPAAPGAAPPAAPAVPDGMKPVGYTHPFYLQVKQVGGFTCQYESFGLFTAPLYAAPAVREPLTDEQLEEIVAATGHGSALFDFARAIEAAHGITGGSNG